MNEILKIKKGVLIGCLDKKATKVTIPDGVTTIGYEAFYGCNSLTTVTVPDSVTAVGEGAFYGCDNLTAITIPDGVKAIGNDAFAFCESLTDITIPDSVTTIGKYAFLDCKSLKAITIPDSVTAVGEGAFYGCNNLTAITIPDGVTTIGYEAFYGCNSLTTVIIPDGVTTIGYEAFCGCDNLKTKKDCYKAVNIKEDKLICDRFTKPFEYKINEWTDEITDIGICKSGYHYCTNLFDIFNYYYGKINEDIAIFICEVGDRVICNDEGSKCSTNKIKLVKRLTNEEIIKLLNN